MPWEGMGRAEQSREGVKRCLWHLLKGRIVTEGTTGSKGVRWDGRCRIRPLPPTKRGTDSSLHPFRPSWIMASETQMREGDPSRLAGCTVHRDLGQCGSEVQQHSREFSDSHTRKYTAVVVSSVCGNKTSLLFFADPITKKSAHFDDFIDCRGNASDKLAYYCANLGSRTYPLTTMSTMLQCHSEV